MSFGIRDATEQDLIRLWEMQKAMVELQGLEWKREITISEFKDELFGERPVTNFKVCESGSDENCQLIGFISYFFGVSYPHGKIAYIEDIYVDAEYRRSGAGKALMGAAVKAALERGCHKTMLHCANWNDKAYQFYKCIGMEDEHSRILYFDATGMKKFGSA